jgi:hypothetical protein
VATYAELLTASENAVLFGKVRVAVVIASEKVRTEAPATPNHDLRLKWAKEAFTDPVANTQRMLWAVLAQNQGATLAQITGASDATVQTAVDAAVDVFAV